MRSVGARGSRTLRAAIIAVSLLVVLSLAIALLVQQLLTSDGAAAAEIPPEIPYVGQLWNHPVALPTFLPACVQYRENGARLTPADYAGGNQVLSVLFSWSEQPGCDSPAPLDLQLVEAPTLRSLSGQVTTISRDRLQFARLEEATTTGASRLTLQWLCDVAECRLSATLSDRLTEDQLVRLAASVRPLKL